MINRRQLIKSGLYGLGALSMARSSLLSAASAGYGIVGRMAPELEVDYWIDQDGRATRFSLAANKDKWVFLKCFQSWCPGCHSHGLPAVKKISETLADNPNIVFAGIQTVFEGGYINTVDKVREIQLQYDLKKPMGHDPGDNGRSNTMMSYRTGGTPWMILISPEREVMYNDFGIDTDRAIEFLTRVAV
jgi:thiol-disulfide isomerase/thioredoxin